MKAIVIRQFGGPEVLRCEDVAPAPLATGQVRVRLHAVGVNPVETYVRAGSYGPRAFPFTPGTDAAGVVEAVGPAASRFAPGDRVYTSGSVSGTYAELAVCAETDVHPLPAGVSFESGAALGVPYATAYRALFQRAQAVPGEWVLVHGASGGVGTAAVQLARAAGMRVVGTAGTEAGRRLVAENGAHQVLDHRCDGCLEALAALTDGRGVDVIVEMLANVNLARDLTVLAPGGRVVVVGSRGRVEIDPREAMRRDAAVLGMVLFNTPPAELASIHAALAAGLESGTLRPRIARSFPLEQAAEAHRAVMEPGALGKIVLLNSLLELP